MQQSSNYGGSSEHGIDVEKELAEILAASIDEEILCDILFDNIFIVLDTVVDKSGVRRSGNDSYSVHHTIDRSNQKSSELSLIFRQLEWAKAHPDLCIVKYHGSMPAYIIELIFQTEAAFTLMNVSL